jgi:hypothetical protein
MDNEIDPNLLDDLIINGAIEFRGVDDNGKILYGFTENAKDVAPEAYGVFVETFYKQIVKLWEKGFLDMDITKMNPVVTPTEKAFNKDDLSLLPNDLGKALEFLIDSMKK